MTITGLAEAIAVDRTTMATNVKLLARRNLVAIETSATDRRARIIALTTDGRARFEEALPLWRAAQSRFEESFGSGKAADLRAVLKAVLDTGLDPWAE
jgi:DNA-binding MarR family transcriptional regulator